MKKKMIIAVFTLLLIFILVNIMGFFINLQKFSQDKEIEKAKVVASIIEDGLTSHMLLGTMNQRELFLKNAQNSSGALNIWTFRINKVTELFGKGFVYESVRDAIDKKVIKTGKRQKVIDNNLFHTTFGLTMPYIATSKVNKNLSCHTNAKEDDVLGGNKYDI